MFLSANVSKTISVYQRNPNRVERLHVGKLLIGSLIIMLLTSFFLVSQSPAHATSGTWFWQNPLPQGNQLRGINCPAANRCFAVGESGTIVSYNGTVWSTQISPVIKHFMSVSCPAINRCFAVGESGTIVSYNGTVWSTQISPTSHILMGISCAAANRCFAVGESGTIVSYNGTVWSTQISPVIKNFVSVSCPAINRCFAVGESGTIVSYNGTVWSTQISPVNDTLMGISCPAVNSCFVADYSGMVVHYNGTIWSSQTLPITTLISISCPTTTRCFVVGDKGTIMDYNGTTWSNQISPGTNLLLGISCLTVTDCFSVGDNGTIVHYNGIKWSELNYTATHNPLNGISCPTSTRCFAVGYGGAIVSYNGVTWSSETSPTPFNLRAISCPSTTRCFAVGDNRTIVGYNGTTWSVQASYTSTNLLGISCPTTTRCFAVSSDYTLVSYNGTAWSSQTLPVNSLYAIDCPAVNSCFAVGGNNGTIVHYNGTTWSKQTPPIPYLFTGISCPSTTRCFATVDNGMVITYDGNTWSSQATPSNYQLSAISCPSTTNCFAVGYLSTVLSTSNGMNWSEEATPISNSLNGISCPAINKCFAVGYGSIIVSNFTPPVPNYYYAPYTANGGEGYASSLDLFNSTTSSGTITVSFYDRQGAVLKTDTLNTPATAHIVFDQSDLPAPGIFQNNIGSAIITSTVPLAGSVALNSIFAPGNPNYHGAMAYSLVSTPKMSLELPTILKNAFGGYNTGLNIQNPNPVTATVTLNIYNSGATGVNGAPVGTLLTYIIPPFGSRGVYNGADPDLPNKFIGSARITSVNVPVVVNVNEFNLSGADPNSGMSYEAQPSPANVPMVNYFPLADRLNSNGTITGSTVTDLVSFNIRNTDTNNSNSVTVSFYSKSGTWLHSDTIVIPANGVYINETDVSSIFSGNDYTGSVIVTSTTGVAVTANHLVYSTGADSNYNGITTPATHLVAPRVTNNYNGGYTSVLDFQNSATTPATVSITFIADGSGRTYTQGFVLGAKSQTSLSQSYPGVLPTGFYGSAYITSTQPIVVITEESKTGEPGSLRASNTIILP